ncbi:MAG: dihydrolipoamide acetyltransferase [Myxococcales bacterium]|nr:dihydrolipoamide acetyltransferase [Myxococcales bacterium]
MSHAEPAADGEAEPTTQESAAASGPAARSPAKKQSAATSQDVAGVEDTGRRETEVYGERLTGIEQEVSALKDRVFRSRARLAVLRDTVLRGVMAGSRLVATHRNIMGSGFRLVKIVVVLDGAQVFIRDDDTGDLDKLDEFEIYDGNLVPGPHRIGVELTYQGNGYGVFSYLRDYSFTNSAVHDFDAPKDGEVKLVSVGFEKGNITTEMQDRPAVEWQTIDAGAGKSKRIPPARGSANAGAAASAEKAEGESKK